MAACCSLHSAGSPPAHLAVTEPRWIRFTTLVHRRRSVALSNPDEGQLLAPVETPSPTERGCAWTTDIFVGRAGASSTPARGSPGAVDRPPPEGRSARTGACRLVDLASRLHVSRCPNRSRCEQSHVARVGRRRRPLFRGRERGLQMTPRRCAARSKTVGPTWRPCRDMALCRCTT